MEEITVTCNGCGLIKPVAEYETRPDTKKGYRGTCRDCRRSKKNEANRRWYQSHREQELVKSAKRRDGNRHHRRSSDFRYRLLNRDKVNARSREYYRRHRERLIAAAIERRNRYRSLDYGWQWDAKHDVVQADFWNDRFESTDMVSEILLRKSVYVG